MVFSFSLFVVCLHFLETLQLYWYFKDLVDKATARGFLVFAQLFTVEKCLTTEVTKLDQAAPVDKLEVLFELARTEEDLITR